MMESAGLLLTTLAFALMLVPPLHATIAGHRISGAYVEGGLLEPHHPAPPRPDIDALLCAADNTLANDPLIRATAAIAEAYDQA